MQRHRVSVFLGIAVAGAFLCGAQPAQALPPFWKQFEAKFVTPNADKAKALKSAKCNVCHVEGEEKAVRNPFGSKFDELVDGAALKKLIRAEPEKAEQQIVEALDKVAAMKLKPDDDESMTFGDVLAEGKLPHEAVEEAPKVAAAEEAEAEEATAESAEPEDADQEAVANVSGKAGVIAQLITELVEEGQEELKAELAAELRSELSGELREQLRAELRPQLTAEIKRSLDPPTAEEEQVAIKKIEEIGGTVRTIAMNDDSKEVDFHLQGKELDDEGLAYVKDLRDVVQLHLKDTQITDEGLAHIASLVTLEKLHLERTKVTDAGLQHLKGLGNLEYLNLYGTSVTDAGLEQLKGLARLEKLYIWQTGVTVAGTQQLNAALPDLEIIPDLVAEQQREEEEAQAAAEEKAAEEKLAAKEKAGK